MAWTAAHQSTLDRYAKFAGMPYDDTDARAWTLALAEQFAFTFPTEGWGTKRADPTRPPSTDCICTHSPFIGYDVIVGQGTSHQAIAVNPAPINLAGQVFISVAPVDHIGGGEPQPIPPPAIITRDEFYTRFKAVNDYYAAPEGLKRPGGMVIDSASPVRADHEAMGKWGYDLMLGKTVDQCKAEIRQSDEWKSKHPGETP